MTMKGLLRAGVAGLLFVLLAASLAFLSAFLVIFLAFGGSASAVAEAECGVVFGAAVYGSDRPGPAVIRRVETAANLYKNGKIEKFYLTGGRGGAGGGAEDAYSEAEVMRRLAMEQGIPSNVITIENQARSTLDNIRLTRPLTSGCESVAAISDQFHMARIKLLASREGWNTLRLMPAEERPPSHKEVQSVLREIMGYIYYALHIDALIETETLLQWRSIEAPQPGNGESA